MFQAAASSAALQYYHRPNNGGIPLISLTFKKETLHRRKVSSHFLYQRAELLI